MPLNWSELGVNITMFFSKTYCLDFLYADGLVNLKYMMEKTSNANPTSSYPPCHASMAGGPTICICEMSVWCWEAL